MFAQAFLGMAGCFQKLQPALAEADLIAVTRRSMWEFRAAGRAEIDAGPGARGQLAMT